MEFLSDISRKVLEWQDSQKESLLEKIEINLTEAERESHYNSFKTGIQEMAQETVSEIHKMNLERHEEIEGEIKNRFEQLKNRWEEDADKKDEILNNTLDAQYNDHVGKLWINISNLRMLEPKNQETKAKEDLASLLSSNTQKDSQYLSNQIYNFDRNHLKLIQRNPFKHPNESDIADACNCIQVISYHIDQRNKKV